MPTQSGYVRLETERSLMNAHIPERRATDRRRLRIPLRLRVWGTSDREHVAESVDISERGVLLETSLPLRVGTVVVLRLRFPAELTRQTAAEWRCRGQVVHVSAARSLNGPEKVGVRFERVEVARR